MKYIIYYKRPDGYENVLSADSATQLKNILDDLTSEDSAGDETIIKVFTL